MTHHFRTHTIDADQEKHRSKAYNSLGNISLDHFSHDPSVLPRESLKAHDKRALIDSFLKNEDVFKLLYETVFTPSTGTAATEVMRSD